MRIRSVWRAGAVLLVLLTLVLSPVRRGAAAREPRTVSVVIFPTLNTTGLEVWESKYYPYNVLERRMSEYLETLYKRSPLIEARILDESGVNQWLAGARRGDDMAGQMELCEAVLKERRAVGSVETGRVQLRLRVYDSAHVKQVAVRSTEGADRRFTLDSPEGAFWLDAAAVSLFVPFKNGLDLFGLTEGKDRGQRMSRPTWDQFRSTSHWQAVKNAIDEAYRQSMAQMMNVIHSNEPQSASMANDTFSPTFSTVGRILAPTAHSTRRRREYIISLGGMAQGSQDSVRVGEVLDVVRSDTYVTVDPEHPVAVLPEVIGKVKVIRVYDLNAVVRVIKDNKKEPIALKDMVIKRTGVSGRR